MHELQVPPSDRTRLGRVDRARRVCETNEEAGPHGRRTKTPHPFEAGCGSRGGVWQAGGLRELRLRRRPDDGEQDPAEVAGPGEGVPERSVRGEAKVRYHAAILERAAGEAETILVDETQTGRIRTFYGKVHSARRLMRHATQGSHWAWRDADEFLEVEGANRRTRHSSETPGWGSARTASEVRRRGLRGISVDIRVRRSHTTIRRRTLKRSLRSHQGGSGGSCREEPPAPDCDSNRLRRGRSRCAHLCR